MTLQLTDRPGVETGSRPPLDSELLLDELADLLAGSIEIRQLLWNLGPGGQLDLQTLFRNLAQDCLRWTDQIAERLWDGGIGPSNACVRPLLRPDPTGGRRLGERAAGMTAGHLMALLAERTAIRAEDDRVTDPDSRALLAGIARKLSFYADLAREPDE